MGRVETGIGAQLKEVRWARLAALGVQSEIPTPDGEAKMSAVILQLAEPLLERHGTTAKRAQTIISLAVAGWNKSIFPADKQPAFEKDLIDCFVPKGGEAETVVVAVEVMDFIADRHNKLCPNLQKIIVDYEVTFSGDSLTLNVSSAPIPGLG